MQSLEEILYFDEPGIDSLSNQIGPGRLVDLSNESEHSREGSGAIKPKFGFGSILAKLGGPTLEIEGEAAFKRGGIDKSVQRFTPTREGRYIELLSKIGGATALKRSLEQAWHAALGRDGSIFCIIEARFRPIGNDSWFEEANESHLLQLTDCASGAFRMGMSFSNLVGIRDGNLTATGHLARRIRDGANLRIFGKMDRTRYIKPFVVSWM